MGDDENKVQAKEVADIRVAIAELCTWKKMFEKLVDEREIKTAAALVLQRTENDRRLEELNGKAKQDQKDREQALLQIKEMRGEFVAIVHLNDIMKPINAKLVEFQTHNDSEFGKNSRANFISIGAAIIAAAGILIQYVK